MNNVTKWFDHPMYNWMDPKTFSSKHNELKKNATKENVAKIIACFENLTLIDVEFYPAGTYSEPEKTTLDNVDDFYLIRLNQKISENHTGTMRVYLPVNWNHRFMGISGAGTNTEVDWFTSPTFNVISWPIALKNGYAAAVADNDTGIRLDCTWGFDKDGNLEWDQIEGWIHKTIHEMTVCAKTLITFLYGEPPYKSYIHGTSGGAREALSEAVLHPEDYDGVWADGPAVNNLDLMFACVWAAVVEANEKHIVALSKYKLAHKLAIENIPTRDYPFNSKSLLWMNFINELRGMETEDGPITDRDLQVMIKTWEGPFTSQGNRMAYGYGPAIRQWPIETGSQFYGYFKRKPDGRLVLMPIAEQALRWFSHEPQLDIHSLTYDQFETIYKKVRYEFGKIDFNVADYAKHGKLGGKVIVTHGTGDCVVPYQAAIDYYRNVLDHFPSEKIMNDSYRLFMPVLAGHSILDWSGAAVNIHDGMLALTDWVENNNAPEKLPTMNYDFINDKPFDEGEVEVFNQWKYQVRMKELVK